MSKDNLINGFINPLICLDADERPPFNGQVDLKAESVLEYLADDSRIISVEEMKRNYNQIAKRATLLWMVPAEAKILMKMVFPLKHAIGYYMIGNFLESIAISGFVAEMATIFKFQIYNVSVIGKPLTTQENEEENLKKVERMKQFKRTEKLLTLGLIDQNLKDKFDSVSNKRNEYLHSFSADDSIVADVAMQVFNDTLDILLEVTGLGIRDGKAVLDQRILDYLRKRELLNKGKVQFPV